MSEDEGEGSLDTDIEKTAALLDIVGENSRKENEGDKQYESEQDLSEKRKEDEEVEELKHKNLKDKGDDSDEDDDKDGMGEIAIE